MTINQVVSTQGGATSGAAGAQAAAPQVATAQQAGAAQAAAATPAATAAQTGATNNVPVSSLLSLEELLGRPVTLADVQQIRVRANELSTQLRSARGRRDEVVRELNSPTLDQSVRDGLQQRLKVLDDRLIKLETDIAANSQMNAAIPPALLAEARSIERPPDPGSPIPGLPQDAFIGLSFVFTIFVLAPIAFAHARRIWRRPVAVEPGPHVIAANERMVRMEQAIDAVAVEVERISEGQRFVTQLLAKRDEVKPLPVSSGGH